MSQIGKPLDVPITDAPFDLDAEMAINFASPGFVQKPISDNLAMGLKPVAEGVTTSDVVQITGNPRKVGIALDASGYLPGVALGCALQMFFAVDGDWTTVMYFTVTERGTEIDGKTPASEWGATFFSAIPIPDCQARVVTILKGAAIPTAAKIRF